MSDTVPSREHYRGLAESLNRHGIADAFVRTYGPIYADERSGPSLEIDEPSEAAWYWWAMRTLVRTLMIEAPQAFDDLLSRMRPLVSHEWEEHTVFLSLPWSEIDAWTACWGLDDERASPFVVLLLHEASHRLAQETYREKWSDLDEAISRYFDQHGVVPLGRGTVFDLQPWSLAIPAWHPGLLPQRNYVSFAREVFEQALAAHIAMQRAAEAAAGMAPVSRKRRAHEHFRWYIRFQVLKQSLGTIAGSDFAEVGAVSSAIHDIARRVDMPVRPGLPGGRPKKSDPAP